MGQNCRTFSAVCGPASHLQWTVCDTHQGFHLMCPRQQQHKPETPVSQPSLEETLSAILLLCMCVNRGVCNPWSFKVISWVVFPLQKGMHMTHWRSKVMGVTTEFDLYRNGIILSDREANHKVKPWLVECCFISTETVGLLGMGTQGGHLNFQFHTAPELFGTLSTHLIHCDWGWRFYRCLESTVD